MSLSHYFGNSFQYGMGAIYTASEMSEKPCIFPAPATSLFVVCELNSVGRILPAPSIRSTCICLSCTCTLCCIIPKSCITPYPLSESFLVLCLYMCVLQNPRSLICALSRRNRETPVFFICERYKSLTRLETRHLGRIPGLSGN